MAMSAAGNNRLPDSASRSLRSEEATHRRRPLRAGRGRAVTERDELGGGSLRAAKKHGVEASENDWRELAGARS